MPLPAPPLAPQPLIEYRKSRRLSQSDVAELVDEVQPTISRLERGQQIPTREQIAKLTRALKCKPEHLFDRATLTVVLARQKQAAAS